MKRNVLLVTNSLASQGGKARVKSARKQPGFDLLNLALHDIDLAIVDIGACMQSLAIVEALSQREPAPPVIALVEGSDTRAMSSLHRHGATACLKKPFNADELARLIEAVCASTSHGDARS